MENKKLIIRSELSSIHEVEQFIEEICDQYNIYTTYYGNILVAVTEAVQNAMQHGNAWNKSKKVTIDFSSSESGLMFQISDEGSGFDIYNIPDPTDFQTENIQKGNGLYLIKSLSDEMSFENNGSTVKLLFDIASINQDVYQDRMKHFRSYAKAGEKIREEKRS